MDNEKTVPDDKPAQPAERETETILRANRQHDGFEDVEVTSEIDEPTLRADALDIGQKLKTTRVRKKMTIASVAKTLKLDIELIKGLEAGDLDQFRGRRAIFVEGHYRAYAGLLNVDVSESSFSVVRARPVTVDTPGNLKINYQQQPTRPIFERMREKSDAIIFALVAVMIMVVGTVIWMVWPVPDSGLLDITDSNTSAIEGGTATASGGEELPFYLRDEQSTPQPSAGEVADLDASSRNPSETELAQQERAIEGDDTVDVLENDAAVSESELQNGEGIFGQSTLVLSFTGDSWVEIYDVNDSVMYYQMGTAGEETRLVGLTPFRILVGDVTTVSLWFDGSEVDLASYAIGAVASLTLQ